MTAAGRSCAMRGNADIGCQRRLSSAAPYQCGWRWRPRSDDDAASRLSLDSLLGHVLGEMPQRTKDARILLIVGTQLNAILLRDNKCDLEDVDRVEPESLPVEWSFGIDLVRLHR